MDDEWGDQDRTVPRKKGQSTSPGTLQSAAEYNRTVYAAPPELGNQFEKGAYASQFFLGLDLEGKKMGQRKDNTHPQLKVCIVRLEFSSGRGLVLFEISHE